MPSTAVRFGPFNYPVLHIWRLDNGTGDNDARLAGLKGTQSISAARVWSYQYDTTSVGLRGAVELLNVTEFPSFLLYKSQPDQPRRNVNSLLEFGTAFTMLDAFITAAHTQLMNDDNSSATLRFATLHNWVDRLHQYVLRSVTKNPAWRLHSLHRLSSTSGAMRSTFYNYEALEIVTLTRGRRCVEKTTNSSSVTTCSTVFVDDYRYERDIVQTSLVDWYGIIAMLRGGAQTYVWIRLLLLVYGAYTASGQSAAEKLNSSSRFASTALIVFKIPFQVIVYSSLLPVSAYVGALILDSSFTDIFLDSYWASVGGAVNFKLVPFIRTTSVEMRGVWSLALFASVVLFAMGSEKRDSAAPESIESSTGGLGSRTIAAHSILQLMNIAMMTDPWNFFWLRVIGIPLYLYHVRPTPSTGNSSSVLPYAVILPYAEDEMEERTGLSCEDFDLLDSASSRDVPMSVLLQCG
ncbi:hypothetical protein PRNP1_005777 [Phytophthora ramorum]